MKFGILTCIHGRHALAAITLKYNLAAARKLAHCNVEIVPVVVGDEAEALEIAASAEWIYVPFANEPLSDRWNAGMLRMKELDVDAVMIFGSDDLVHESVFQSAYDAIHGGKADLFGVLGSYILHVASWTAKFWKGYPAGDPRFGETIGTCRTMRRSLLDDLGWAPWPAGLAKGLDKAFTDRVKGVVEVREEMGHVGSIIDVKAYPLHDMNTFWEATGAELRGQEIFDGFPSHLARDLKEACDPLKTAERVFNLKPVDDICKGHKMLSVCLLVKNERAMIGECLASLRKVAGKYNDEVLVLDTGSTDGTPEIAEAYGAIVRRVQADLPFDFARWRNESLVGAKGKWILIMDGDEWLAEDADIAAELDDVPEKVDAVAFQHHVLGQKAAEGSSVIVRLLRGDKVRSGKIHYEYPNQHQLRGVESFQISAAVTREPWFDPVESALRSIPILEKMLKQSMAPALVGRNGKALGGRTNERNHALLYLSRACAMLGSAAKTPEERNPHFERAALFAGQLVDEQPGQLGAWLVLLAVVEQVKGLLSMEPIIDKAVRQFPDCRDVRWWRMRFDAAVLSVLLAEPDKYPLTPQRYPLWWKLLPDIGPFLWLRFKVGEGKK